MKLKFTVPSPYTVLAIFLVLAAIATWLVPSGSYSKLTYDSDEKVFVLKSDENIQTLPGNQATLDELGITTSLEKFVNGDISKAVAVPGTYSRLPQNPQGLVKLAQSPIEGIYEAVDIIVLVLMIGGFIGVIRMSGMFEAGVSWLGERLKGRESLLVVIVTCLIAAGGTTFGMAEETIAFYPILVPIFLAAGYDAIVPVGAIYGGSTIGTMFSSVNPFAVIIASDAAGVNWTAGIEWRIAGLLLGTIIVILYILRYGNRVRKDPTKSLLYGKKVNPPAAAALEDGDGVVHKMDTKMWILSIVFIGAFLVMVIGVVGLHWWLLEMTTVFIVASVLAGFLIGKHESKFVKAFVRGAEEMLGVSLIIGIARGVTIVMNNGLISDTIIHSASDLVAGMPGVAFLSVLFVIFIVLTFFISSSSGLAVLTMPIMGPLARIVNVPVEQVVNAYMTGFGVMSFITPTGLILPSLMMVDVSFGTWLKFITPLLLILSGFSILFLSAGYFFG